MDNISNDVKFRWRIRDMIAMLAFWQCILMTLCLLYFLHNQSMDLEQQQLQNGVEISQIRELRLTKKLPKDENTDLKYIKHIITEAPEFDYGENVNHTIPGYISVIGNKTLQLFCDSCALVSSSGQLEGKGGGADIDGADCVLRMNAAPVINYQEDVGSRTTVRIIGHPNLQRSLEEDQKMRDEILVNEDTRADFVIIPWLFEVDSNMTNDPAYRLAINYSRDFPKVEFYLFTQEKLQRTSDEFERQFGMTRQEAHTWYSTGFVTMLFAIDICNTIDVYGLPSENYCKKHPHSKIMYHYYNDTINRLECDYYENSENKLHVGHKFLTEKAIFSQWAISHNIRFHYPSWKPVLRNLTILNSPFLKLYNEAKKNGTLQNLQNPFDHKPNTLRGLCKNGNSINCHPDDSKNYTVVRTFYKNGRRIVVKRVVKISKKKPHS